MLISKINPTGLDWYIQQFQTGLHAEMLVRLGISDPNQYGCYGRCYRNKKEKGYIAEVYTSGNEYKEIYWDDTLTVLSFFGISSSIACKGQNIADVHLVVFANLDKLALKDYKNNLIAHRADEELRAIVQDIVPAVMQQSIEMSIENVLREYPGSYRDDRLKFVDMHPVHSFRLNLKMFYDPNKNC